MVRPSSVSQEELLELIDKMNRDWRVSGLLVQLPLPGKHSQRSCTCSNTSERVQTSCSGLLLTVNQYRLCWPFTPQGTSTSGLYVTLSLQRRTWMASTSLISVNCVWIRGPWCQPPLQQSGRSSKEQASILKERSAQELYIFSEILMVA